MQGSGVGPNLWLAAAKGFAFCVHVVWFKDEEFRHIITNPEHSLCYLKWGINRKCHPNLAVIFTDTASIPKLHNLPYWCLEDSSCFLCISILGDGRT